MASDNNETLLAKSERNALSVFTTYQITDDVRLKVDVFANRSGAEETGDSTGGPYLYDGFGGDLDGGYYNYPFFECGHPYMSAATTQKCLSLWPAVPANLGAAVLDDDGNPTFTTTYDPVTGAAIQTPIVVTDPFAGKRGFLVGKTIRDLYDDPRGPRAKGNQDLLSALLL